MAEKAPKDLGPTERLQLSWERGKIVGSLEALFERITKDAESAVHWYIRAKRSKLVPGIHTIKVDGVIGGNRRQAEAAVSITAGGTATVQLTLS